MALVPVLRRIGSAALATALAAFGAASARSAARAEETVQSVPVASAPGSGQPAAQSPTATIPPGQRVKHRAHDKAPQLPVLPKAAEIAPLPAPPHPDWPVADKAMPASVNWNGRELSVDATNSSLKQILTDISKATGVAVQGEETDQRIFGSYGPAPARDVLGQLLDGSGYNVLMIGDQGEGTPRELVLTAKAHAASAAAGANARARGGADDDSADEPDSPEPPEPVQRGPVPAQPGQFRTPQEIDQRQRQLQELQRLQQQQDQQQPPPAPQPPNE